MKNKCLAILGMHRSGTSLAASWLHSSGLFLGEDLLGAGVGNERGHFEDRAFHDLHEEIFRAQGLSYGGLLNLGRLHVGAHEKEMIRNLVADRQMRYTQWGWKDPRSCLFLHVYLDLIPEIRIFSIYRDYRSVVDSLIRRKIKAKEKKLKHKKNVAKRHVYKLFFNIFEKTRISAMSSDYLEAWIIYNEKIIKALERTGPDNYILVFADDIVNEANAICRKIIKWGFNLQTKDISLIYDEKMMKKFVNYESFNPDLIT